MLSLARLLSLRSFDHRSIFTVCLRLCLVFLYGTAGGAFQFNHWVNSGFQLIIHAGFSFAAQDRAAVCLRCAILGCIGAACRRHACCSGAHICRSLKEFITARNSAELHLCRRKAQNVPAAFRLDNNNFNIFHKLANCSASFLSSPSAQDALSC